MQRLAVASLHSPHFAQTQHVLSQGNTLAQDDHPLLRSYDDWDYADDDTTAGDSTTAADD